MVVCIQHGSCLENKVDFLFTSIPTAILVKPTATVQQATSLTNILRVSFIYFQFSVLTRDQVRIVKARGVTLAISDKVRIVKARGLTLTTCDQVRILKTRGLTLATSYKVRILKARGQFKLLQPLTRSEL